MGALLGSGTISGPTRDSRGWMIELARRVAKEPVAISGGTRSFLAEGDTLTLRGGAVGDGYHIGVGGTCCGTVLFRA